MQGFGEYGHDAGGKIRRELGAEYDHVSRERELQASDIFRYLHRRQVGSSGSHVATVDLVEVFANCVEELPGIVKP